MSNDTYYTLLQPFFTPTSLSVWLFFGSILYNTHAIQSKVHNQEATFIQNRRDKVRPRYNDRKLYENMYLDKLATHIQQDILTAGGSDLSGTLSIDEEQFNANIENYNTHRLKHCVIMEPTPYGMVILWFDSTDDDAQRVASGDKLLGMTNENKHSHIGQLLGGSFVYISDSSVPACIVNTVCQKYVIQYHCPLLYQCDPPVYTIVPKQRPPDELIENNNQNTEENSTTKDSRPTVRNSSVFAKFKKYSIEKTDDPLVKTNEIIDEYTTKMNKLSTCFTHSIRHKGTLRDFNTFFKHTTHDKPQRVKQVSFSDYKNLNN